MFQNQYRMDVQLQVKMNPSLFLKDPEQSELGRNIIRHSIEMIDDIGFENFTFRKLAMSIGTTEASIYRYFENKHRLLTYIISWFWTWMEYQYVFYSNNIKEPQKKIETIISLMLFNLEDAFFVDHINKEKLQHIIVAEGNKLYFTKHVDEDNNAKLFKPYKDLCNRIADVFAEYNPEYKYPHSLASTLVETAHHQMFFSEHLPSLTDLSKEKNNSDLRDFLTKMAFNCLGKSN